MNKQMILAAGAAAFAIAVLSAVLPARADEVTSTVTAFDRVAGVLVLKDKSIFALDKLNGDAPATLSAGDRISIDYEGDEDGISAINSITILSEGDQG